MKKFHYVYKTTNLINGKYYIGKHSTDDMNDGYIGSGKAILRAINKHGKQNFEKIIIAEFDTQEEAFQFEVDVITEEMLNDENCYNMKKGGEGNTGISYTKGTKFFNNGQICKRFVEGEQPDGWTRGRLTNINKSRIGVKKDKAFCENLSRKKKGKVPAANLMKVKCPHCDKEGQPANMKRWHFDNCKKKNNV